MNTINFNYLLVTLIWFKKSSADTDAQLGFISILQTNFPSLCEDVNKIEIIQHLMVCCTKHSHRLFIWDRVSDLCPMRDMHSYIEFQVSHSMGN